MWRRRIDAEVAQRPAPDAAIRHDDLHLVVGHQLGPEQRQLLDHANAAADLNLVADPEGPEDQQHDSRRQVRERALQGEPDRQAGGADDGDEARRLGAELRQHREQGDGQDQVAREAAEPGSLPGSQQSGAGGSRI